MGCLSFLFSFAAALRLKYREPKEVFLEKNITVKEPHHLFKLWLNEACETPEILEPNAFCLSTVSECVPPHRGQMTFQWNHFNYLLFSLFRCRDGKPSARFVLMKAFTENGLSFFTNYGSRKAKEMVNRSDIGLEMNYLLTFLRSGIESECCSNILLAAVAPTSAFRRSRIQNQSRRIRRILSPETKS